MGFISGFISGFHSSEVLPYLLGIVNTVGEQGHLRFVIHYCTLKFRTLYVGPEVEPANSDFGKVTMC